MDVDLVLISRDSSPPPGPVRRGIEGQGGVRLNVRRVVGAPGPADPNRWATIARARNEGKRLGTAGWVMFLDDDVVLAPGCVPHLLEGLARRPEFAALAADYLGESRPREIPLGLDRHVAMGATLFRRDRLRALTFRWEPRKCECQCCCDDLRRAGFAIGYLPGAGASHLKSSGPPCHGPDELGTPRRQAASPGAGAAEPRILSAFDRAHLRRFRRQFLRSLRAHGNHEPVVAVCYGIPEGERRILARRPGVEVVSHPGSPVSPAIRRLRDFQAVIARWPEQTPVAYWDAGDVYFQARLEPLWDIVREHPDRLLATTEPTTEEINPSIHVWTYTIEDRAAREYAYNLLAANPYLNGGFAAGTARTMLRYLREADRLRHSPAMRGTLDWGDQTAMNIYCHGDPNRWHLVDNGWNYCLYSRPKEHFRLNGEGRFATPDGAVIPVLHGNARTMRWLELSPLS